MLNEHIKYGLDFVCAFFVDFTDNETEEDVDQ